MGTVLFVAVLALQQPVTVPGNITVVPRGAGDICNADGMLTELRAGVQYEILALVDSTVTYTLIGVHAEPLWGCCPAGGHFRVSMAVPVCPVGTLNAGMRPHLLSLRIWDPGIWFITVVAYDDSDCINCPITKDGVALDRNIRVTVK